MTKVIVFCCFIIGPVMSTLAQDKVKVIKFDALETLLNEHSEGVKVINFWATWCAPCVKELPHFEALQKKYQQQGVEVTLISLDFVEKKQKVEQFIERKSIASKVLLLDEIDYNSWINKVDRRWSGAIPATLILNGNSDQRKFVERELKGDELEQLIQEFMN